MNNRFIRSAVGYVVVCLVTLLCLWLLWVGYPYFLVGWAAALWIRLSP